MAYNTRFRSPGFSFAGTVPPATKWLLIANTAVFLLQYLCGLAEIDPFAPFRLRPVSVVFPPFAVWQLVTYLFLHGGVGHILWNMLSLWMFGSELERSWGSRRYLQYYFICGIGAGICVVIANFILPRGNPSAPTVGASGAIFGLMLAFAVLFPRVQILFMFLFPIEARFFVAIIGALAFLSTLGAGGGGPVSDVAHLGGMLVGFIYLKTGLMKRVPGRAYDFRYGAPRPVYRPSLTTRAKDWYKEWKLQRARRKFEVYLKKRQDRERDHDRYVH